MFPQKTSPTIKRFEIIVTRSSRNFFVRPFDPWSSKAFLESHTWRFLLYLREQRLAGHGRPSRAIGLLFSGCVLSCQGQGSSLDSRLVSNRGQWPRYVGYTGRPWASRPICEVHSLQMGPYGRLISHQVTSCSPSSTESFPTITFQLTCDLLFSCSFRNLSMIFLWRTDGATSARSRLGKRINCLCCCQSRKKTINNFKKFSSFFFRLESR